MRAIPQDRQLATWAHENTRVFGSRDSANAYSDSLRWALWTEMMASSLMLPAEWTGSGYDRWIHTGLVLLTSEVNFATTTAAKDWTRQDRPLNPTARNGFPSAHSSSSSLFGEITRQNLQRTDWSGRASIHFSTYALVGMVGWSRLEAGQHYPSDVLVGWGWGLLLARGFKEFVVPQVRSKGFVPQDSVRLSPTLEGFILQARF